jgi:very-short-patch-repair endonuclease
MSGEAGQKGGCLPNLRARELRWNMTEAERKLWLLLRCKKLAGFRFRRQATIGPYIADFFCPKAKLIVELDGEPHSREDQIRHDQIRTRWLEAHSCRVIRFWNADVFQQAGNVADVIYSVCVEQTDPPSVAPSARHLPPQGGKRD